MWPDIIEHESHRQPHNTLLFVQSYSMLSRYLVMGYRQRGTYDAALLTPTTWPA